METFLIKAAQLILAFAILVIIHEFGHFLFARLFGIRVEKFYIFFNPWATLFKWKPGRYVGYFGKKKRLKNCPPDLDIDNPDADSETDKKGKRRFWSNTEYGIGWLPLGGYCKISGMIDESMDREQMKKEAQPWEFRTKPAWQRLLVMIAGVLFNFLLAILIYAGMVYATGEKYVPFDKAKMGFVYSPEAQKIGYETGDIPLLADGERLDDPGEARLKMLQASEVKVLRGTDTVSISVPEKFIFSIDKETREGALPFSFMTYRMPTRIIQVMPGSAADKAGLATGDEVMALNGVTGLSVDEFMDSLKHYPNQQVELTVLRKNTAESADTLSKIVSLDETAHMGVGLETNPAAFFEATTKNYNIFQSIPRGIELGVNQLTNYVGSMKLVFTKEGAQSIGGFGAIGSIFPESWDWIAFWNIAAFLSVALAFMNILPIPALDGGHVLFLLYEVITRRKPSEKFMEYAQMVGMFLLIALLLYANGMDIVRLFK